MEPVAHAARTAVKAGCKAVVLTNACGGINTDYKVGQPVLIKDHISLTAASPLIGADFVDLTDLYSNVYVHLLKRQIHHWLKVFMFIGAGLHMKLLLKYE